MSVYLTTSDIIAMTGKTKRTIQTWVSSENLNLKSIGRAESTIESVDFLKWWEDRAVRKRVNSTSDGEMFDIAVESTRLKHHQANNEAIKEQTLRGELLPVRMVIELCSAGVANCRNRILAVHNKLRSEFPGLGDEVFERIESLHHDALSQLGNEGVPTGLAERLSVDLEEHTTAAETDMLSVG